MFAIVVLTVVLIMPGDEPNVQQSRPMASLEDCLKASQAWLEQDAQSAGASGLAAVCRIEQPLWRRSKEP